MGRQFRTEDEIASVREEICAAALKLFTEKGYDAVTLRAISTEVGCSAMTPYRYFPEGKKEILAAVKADAFRRFAERQEALLDSVERESIDAIERIAINYVDFALMEPGSFRLMFEIEPQLEDDFPELAQASKQARIPMMKAISQVVEDKGLPGNPLELAQIMWASIHGLVTLHFAGQLKFGYQLQDLLPHLLQILQAGALTRAG